MRFFILFAILVGTAAFAEEATMRAVLRGGKLFSLCANCHTVGQREDHRVGPNLYDILGRDIASAPGFDYSPALSAMGGVWTSAALDEFLQRPNHAVPGTDMTFRGLRNPTDRQDLINWLALQSGTSPLPSNIDALPETLLKGEPSRGAVLFHPCQACHSYRRGEPDKIGPNLFGVVGRPIASAKGFNYSEYILRLKGNWTPERLNAFMFEDKRFAQGSHMAFNSLVTLADRADLIAWLKTISPDYKASQPSE